MASVRQTVKASITGLSLQLQWKAEIVFVGKMPSAHFMFLRVSEIAYK